MSTSLLPPPLPSAAEEQLWAERFTAAALDGPLSDVRWGVEECATDAEAASARWFQRLVDRAELLSEFEHATAQIAQWEAVRTRVLAAALDHALSTQRSGSEAEMSVRDVAAELACAVGLSDRTVQRRMADAATLRDSFPLTLGALGAGQISSAHAQAIHDEGVRLPAEARGGYEGAVIDRTVGGDRALPTAGRLRAFAKAIAEKLHPATMHERHRTARADRRIWVQHLDDGMSEFRALIPTVQAQGGEDRLTAFARVVHEAESAADAECSVESERRTLDQLRADVFCDVLLTGHATLPEIDERGREAVDAIRPAVQITVPVLTLLGGTDTSSDGPTAPAARMPAAPALAGRVPIDPEIARRLAGAATLWDRVLTDPITGDVLAVDRRFPSEAQRRHLRARDEHCRFPGCRMPAARSDIDHTIDHQHGGPTAIDNLAHLCRRHHSLKHLTAWTVAQESRGVLVWTSPEGRIYTDHPPPALRFLAQA